VDGLASQCEDHVGFGISLDTLYTLSFYFIYFLIFFFNRTAYKELSLVAKDTPLSLICRLAVLMEDWEESIYI
jgi:hypothetical protein